MHAKVISMTFQRLSISPVEDIMAAVERQPGGCFYFSVGWVVLGGGLGREHRDICTLVFGV